MKKVMPIILISLLTLLCCCKKETCITCPPPPLDTTSHVIQWQTPDTLGTQGLIRDVWVFDRNNAWAVGEIYLNDSTDKPDISNPYNAAHWDGVKWSCEKIPTALYGGPIVNSPIYTIYAFNENDIWTFSIAGSYSHWNGSIWTTKYVAERSGGGKRLWGTSSSNIYLVGTGGSISHYNGSAWTQMTSNTTVDLQDIWGFDATHIWATGFNNSDGHSVVLQCDGAQWTTIYDNANKPLDQVQYFNTVWTDNANYLFLDGGSFTNVMDLHNGTFRRTDSLSTNEVFNIRGITHNDIFRVGYGGESVHYNGASWYLYPELKVLNGGTTWFFSVFPNPNMILIGGFIPTALNGFPVVIRGYR